MKAVILAGGFGTRIAEESHLRPKPMIEIGGKPILWHIMKIFSAYGVTDFVICCGYKGYYIKEYFSHYALHHSDVTFDFRKGTEMIIHHRQTEPWQVTLVDTGLHTMTGGRVKRAAPYLGEERFFVTYGDGVADVDITKLLAFHEKMGKKAFREKADSDSGWINGGFLVLEPSVLSYLKGDETILEQEPLSTLAAEGELSAYQHRGFWQCMDTLRDKEKLEQLWKEGAPWRIWEK